MIVSFFSTDIIKMENAKESKIKYKRPRRQNICGQREEQNAINVKSDLCIYKYGEEGNISHPL